MPKTDRIFITGATGFLGSYLLRLLVASGYTNILALKRSSSPLDLVREVIDQVEWVEGDVLDVPLLESAMEGCQKVYHCAAIVTQAREDIPQMMRINVEGTANVVNVANYRRVNKLLYTSSISALGRHKKEQHLDENSHWIRNAFNTDYGTSKYLGEQEVWRGMAEGLNAVIINPSVIIGSGYWDKGTAVIFDTVWKGLRFYPSGTTGFVDVRDVAQLCLQLMESDIRDIRLIANAADWSFRDFFTAVANAMGKKPPGIAATPLINAIAWRADWLRAKLTGGQHIITKSRLKHTAGAYYYNNQRSKDLLGFAYRPLEDAIAETSAQFVASRKNGEAGGVLSF